jgi:hypothetical protein
MTATEGGLKNATGRTRVWSVLSLVGRSFPIVKYQFTYTYAMKSRFKFHFHFDDPTMFLLRLRDDVKHQAEELTTVQSRLRDCQTALSDAEVLHRTAWHCTVLYCTASYHILYQISCYATSSILSGELRVLPPRCTGTFETLSSYVVVEGINRGIKLKLLAIHILLLFQRLSE